MGQRQQSDQARTVVVSADYPHSLSLGEMSFELNGHGLNPLLDAATALLALAVRLRHLSDYGDCENLRLLIINEIKTFQQTLEAQDTERGVILSARYILCSLIDEAVLNTPWGASSGWSKKSLLSHFYHDTSGGETVYHILSRLQTEPARNKQMIELLYVCLRLGFQGKFATIENGSRSLDLIAENLYSTISPLLPQEAETLSDHLTPCPQRQSRLRRWLSIRLIGGLTAVVLIAGYLWMNAAVKDALVPVKTDLETIARGGM
jgi:type VI secretion system protein ImpK